MDSMGFDESDTYFYFSSNIGISLYKNREPYLKLGSSEQERFVNPQLYQGKAQKTSDKSAAGFGGKSSQVSVRDPTMFCTAQKKNRFYLFTRREPELENPNLPRDM